MVHSSALTLGIESLIAKGVHVGCSGTKEAQGGPPHPLHSAGPWGGEDAKMQTEEFLKSGCKWQALRLLRVGR